MPNCSALGCKNRAEKKVKAEKGISYFSFPKNEKVRDTWIKAMRRPNFVPSRSAVLCSQHFREEDIDRSSMFSVRLEKNAVPSIFTFPSGYKTIKIEQEAPILPAVLCECVYEEPELSEETESSVCDAAVSPIKKELDIERIEEKRKIDTLEEQVSKHRKKRKLLQQEVRRQKKKINNLNSLFDEIKEKKIMEPDALQLLKDISGPCSDLLVRQLSKIKGKALPKVFSPELRSFALTLHFYSAHAYEFVRETFDTCLPNSKTISSWYKTIDAAPGFTSEALKALSLKVEANPSLLFNLVFDEMAVKKHVEFDGTDFHGYVEMGAETSDDCMPLAKEALVFMVVPINDYWKIPVGYFLIDSINSTQKANLIKQCLTLLHNSGVRVVSVTFNGLPANLSAAKELGCIFDPHNLKTTFPHPETKKDVSIVLDPRHILKCVRNALEGKKSMVDNNGDFVSWEYVTLLTKLQENEDLNLGNKLKSSHVVNFFRQKMKIKLAAQTLSKSVADALKFCLEVLKIPEFSNCEATIRFLLNINDVFDILNSRSHMQVGYKKALWESNFYVIDNRLENIKQYILALRIDRNSTLMVNSNQQTGFLGILICIESIRNLFEELVIKEEILESIAFYKFSLDHIELFFQVVRSCGGCSNNPTARQFKSAYKKLLMKSEIKGTQTGHCIPLEDISILCANPETVINKCDKQGVQSEQMHERNVPDLSDTTGNRDQVTNRIWSLVHDYMFDPGCLTIFSEHVVHYISGFVVSKLTNSLKCTDCISALYCDVPTFKCSLISYKSRGGLVHPSHNVFKICKTCENVFCKNVSSDGGFFLKKKAFLETEISVLSSISVQRMFSKLDSHCFDHSLLENHKVNLIRAIIKKYLLVKFYYRGKNIINKEESCIQNYCFNVNGADCNGL